MLDIKSKSGLAFNQNLILEHYYSTKNLSCDCVICNPQYRSPRKKSVLELTVKQVIKARGRLHSKGYVGHKSGGVYFITDKGINAIESNDYIRSGPTGPYTAKCQKIHKGTLIYYLWAALRTKGTATISELLTLTPIESKDYDKTYENARRLLHWLHKAHIIRKLPRKQAGLSQTSNGFIRYQLMIDLGPKHPVIRVRKHQIFDQNKQINIPFKDVLKTFKKDP